MCIQRACPLNMEFRRQKKARVQIDNALSFKYPHDLQLYKNPPDAQITLNEFEELAIERLKGKHTSNVP